VARSCAVLATSSSLQCSIYRLVPKMRFAIREVVRIFESGPLSTRRCAMRLSVLLSYGLLQASASVFLDQHFLLFDFLLRLCCYPVARIHSP